MFLENWYSPWEIPWAKSFLAKLQIAGIQIYEKGNPSYIFLKDFAEVVNHLSCEPTLKV